MSRFKIGNIVKDKESDKIGKIVDIWRSKHYHNPHGEKRVDVIYCVRLNEPLASKSVYVNRYGSSLKKQLFKVKSSMKNFHPTLTVYDYKSIHDGFNVMDFTLATRIEKRGERAIIKVGFAKKSKDDEPDNKIAIKKAEWRAKYNPICEIVEKKWKDISEEYAHALMDGQYMWLRKHWKEFVEEEKTKLIPYINNCKKIDKELRRHF